MVEVQSMKQNSDHPLLAAPPNGPEPPPPPTERLTIQKQEVWRATDLGEGVHEAGAEGARRRPRVDDHGPLALPLRRRRSHPPAARRFDLI